MADRADIHDLYERSVQAVDVEVEFLQDTFRALRGRSPITYREDFCGTAAAACEWVRSGAGRRGTIGFGGHGCVWLGGGRTAACSTKRGL